MRPRFSVFVVAEWLYPDWASGAPNAAATYVSAEDFGTTQIHECDRLRSQSADGPFRGTEGSNSVPSSGESGANRIFGSCSVVYLRGTRGSNSVAGVLRPVPSNEGGAPVETSRGRNPGCEAVPGAAFCERQGYFTRSPTR